MATISDHAARTKPTFQDLIGRIEHVAQIGTLVTHFPLIKPGSLHRANGGYLIVDELTSTPRRRQGSRAVDLGELLPLTIA